MQLKYNRKQSFGNIFFKFLIRILITIVLIVASIFLIEKINFPSPEKKYEIDITNEIKKL